MQDAFLDFLKVKKQRSPFVRPCSVRLNVFPRVYAYYVSNKCLAAQSTCLEAYSSPELLTNEFFNSRFPFFFIIRTLMNPLHTRDYPSRYTRSILAYVFLYVA